MKKLTADTETPQWTNQALKELVDHFSFRGNCQCQLEYYDDQIIEQFDHFELELYQLH